MRSAGRLDALLSTQSGAAWMAGPEDDEVAPLLAAAGRLAPLRRAVPASDFAGVLETRLIARAAALASQRASMPAATGDPAFPEAVVAPRRERGAARDARADLARRVRRLPHVFWPAAAAALVLVVGAGTLTAAAAAGPGSLLYALHRWEQSVQAQLAATPADRMRLHLANARDALTALQRAATRHAGDPAYSDALATVQTEDQAAAAALADVPAGAEHDALTAQLVALHDAERQDLRAALPDLGWSDRVATTQALGGLGESVPWVTGVQAQQSADGHGNDWLITVTGSGFQPGALLVVNGRPVGQVVAVAPDSLTVAVTTGDMQRLAHGGGVDNPDGTAAALSQFSVSSQEATPSPGGHGNGGKGGGHGRDATPTPSGN